MPNNVIGNIGQYGRIIARGAAGMFRDKVQFLKSIDKEPVSTFGNYNGYKPGATAAINRPARFTMGTSANITATLQSFVEDRVNLTVDRQRNVPLDFSSAELATNIDINDFMKRVVEPAVASLAQNVEAEALATVKNQVFNYVGTPGATVFDTNTMLAANQKLNEFACPDFDNRFALLNPAAQTSAVNARKGFLQATDKVSKQYNSGLMGVADGLIYLQNNMLPVHTQGTATGTITVTAAPATGATSINLTGTGSQVLTAGTVFTIAGVNAVHPITKASLGYLQQFVVTADNTASSGAYTGVQISPTIFGPTSGSLQNVSALPATSANVTIFSGAASTSQVNNLVFHKDAFRCAFLPLFQPKGVDMVAQETEDGITMRVLRDYDPITDLVVFRLDLLYGITTVRPEWATRVTA